MVLSSISSTWSSFIKGPYTRSAVFGFISDYAEKNNIDNHILLIFKIFLFKNRTYNPALNLLLARIKNIAKIEGQLCFTEKQLDRYSHKWGFLDNLD